MSIALRSFFAALLVLLSAWPAFAEKAYVRDALASDAVRLETKLKGQVGSGQNATQLKTDGDRAWGARNWGQAYDIYARLVVVEPKNWQAWSRLGFAAGSLAAASNNDYSKKYQYQNDANAAAYLGYQRATAKGDEATALAVLGATLSVSESYRNALDAYRISLDLADNPDVRATYTALREKHGFRLIDYKVDSDAASPRACFNFSEELAKGKVDYTPFVVVSGIATPAVTAEGQQLCVDGLEHGKKYGIVLRQGIPSAVHENLLKSADYDIYVRDRSAQVRFTGKNYVLPSTGQEGLPVVSVNTQKVDIEVYRYGDRSLLPTVRGEEFLKSLDGVQVNRIATEKGFKVWSGAMDVQMVLNQDVVTAFPVLEAVGKLEPGIYVMTAKPPGPPKQPNEDGEVYDYDSRATQWFIVSDLGLTALSGGDGVTVLVRSLTSAKPVAGVEMRLVARNNEVLAAKKTDDLGRVRFEPGLTRGTGGMAPGIVVAADGQGDYGFLDLVQAAFDLTDRGVKGRVAPVGLDGFLYTERGVYRSGETVYVTALLRDTKGAAVPSVPLTLVAQRPDGVEYRRQVVEDQGAGGRAWAVNLISGLPTGTWRVKAYADPKRPPVGETSFLLEDYVPERIELGLMPKAAFLRPGEPAIIDVDAKFLYGAPGAELELRGDVTIDAAEKTTVPGLEKYAIGLDDETFQSVTKELEEPGTTDENGKASVTVPIPEVKTTRPVVAKVDLTVTESGGRAVDHVVTIPILPAGNVIGVRKLFDDGGLTEGGTAGFDVVMATGDGKRLERKGLKWQLLKVDKRYTWFNTDGKWDYEVVRATRRLSDGRIDVGTTDPTRITVPVDWGSYRLEVRAEDGDGAVTSVSFAVGWAGSDKADAPDVLDVALDKTSFAAGESVNVRLSPRFAGQATVAVVSDKIETLQVVDIASGGTTVSFKADPAWGSGAYVLAMAHRPLDKAAKRLPGRAMGVAWFAIDKASRTIDVSLGVPQTMRPRGTMHVPVKLAGLTAGEEAQVVVSAVDVGILNLTHYQAPDPNAFYQGQMQLSSEVRDLYGFLIDGMQGTRGAIKAGGDTAPTFDTSPPKEAPLARYSGVVKVGADGTADIPFDIPAFNGTVRVMAVAWSASKLGHAQADVIVRDAVVLQATLPRFLAIGDQSRFFMAIDNVEGPAGDYRVDLDIRGPIVVAADSLRSTVKLAAKGRGSLSIPVTAAGVGTAVVDVRLSGPGIDALQTLSLKVQPSTPEVYRRSVRPLAPGASLTVSSDLTADFVPGTGSVSVAVTPYSALDVPGLLKALDRYPYGCTEQIVSRALPLLYVNKLASEESLALDEKVDQRIRDAVDRVMTRQDSNGSFGLWTPGGDDTWLDAYVADFLTRARERGFAVPTKAFELALDRLRNFVANTQDPTADNAADLAYAAYVLARNGRPVMGDLRYLTDQKLSVFWSPLSRAQLGAGLAMLGDRSRALPVFQSALDVLAVAKGPRAWRSDYGSVLRDGAGIMALMAESGQGTATFQKAVATVDQTRSDQRYTSTQENAWMVLAAFALMKDSDKLSLTVDGEAKTGGFAKTWTAGALEGRTITIANTSNLPAQMVVTSAGHPLLPDQPAAEGYQVERTYHKLDGTKVDPSTVRQTDRLVVVLKVTEQKASRARIMLVDHLPAGFEIDNPKLVDSAEMTAFSWMKTAEEPTHTEYRDDRFVAVYERQQSQSAFFHVAYVVRAVSPGRYIHPPAVVEDMYRPERYGRTAFGQVEVTPAK